MPNSIDDLIAKHGEEDVRKAFWLQQKISKEGIKGINFVREAEADMKKVGGLLTKKLSKTSLQIPSDMKVTTAVSNLISHLTADVSAQVQIAGSDGRPVPSVTVQDWTLKDLRGGTDDFRGVEFNDDGQVTAKVYRIPYEMRIELLITHNDSVAAHDLFADVRESLRDLEKEPRSLHADMRRANMRGGSGISHQFNEPTEHELNQSLMIEAVEVMKRKDVDYISDINNIINPDSETIS